jgi:hypothetical protein
LNLSAIVKHLKVLFLILLCVWQHRFFRDGFFLAAMFFLSFVLPLFELRLWLLSFLESQLLFVLGFDLFRGTKLDMSEGIIIDHLLEQRLF